MFSIFDTVPVVAAFRRPAIIYSFPTTRPKVASSDYVANNHSRIVNLPPNIHVDIAHTLASRVNDAFALFAKFQLLNSSPVREFCQAHPRVAVLLKLVALVQLRPLSVLEASLLKSFRPLHWLLAPFTTMALPVALTIVKNGVQSLRRTVLPKISRSPRRTLAPQFCEPILPSPVPHRPGTTYASPDSTMGTNTAAIIRAPCEDTPTTSLRSVQVGVTAASPSSQALSETLSGSPASLFEEDHSDDMAANVGNTSANEDAPHRKPPEPSREDANSQAIPDTVTYINVSRSIDFSVNNSSLNDGSYDGDSSCSSAAEADTCVQEAQHVEGNTNQTPDWAVRPENPGWFAMGIERARGHPHSYGLADIAGAGVQPGISHRLQ